MKRSPISRVLMRSHALLLWTGILLAPSIYIYLEGMVFALPAGPLPAAIALDGNLSAVDSSAVGDLSRKSPAWRRKFTRRIFGDIEKELTALNQALGKARSAEGKRLIARVRSSLKQMEKGKNAFVKTGRETSLKPFYVGRTWHEFSLWKLKNLAGDLNLDDSLSQIPYRVYALTNKWLVYVAHREISARRSGLSFNQKPAETRPESAGGPEKDSQITEVARVTEKDIEKASEALSREPKPFSQESGEESTPLVSASEEKIIARTDSSPAKETATPATDKPVEAVSSPITPEPPLAATETEVTTEPAVSSGQDTISPEPAPGSTPAEETPETALRHTPDATTSSDMEILSSESPVPAPVKEADTARQETSPQAETVPPTVSGESGEETSYTWLLILFGAAAILVAMILNILNNRRSAQSSGTFMEEKKKDSSPLEEGYLFATPTSITETASEAAEGINPLTARIQESPNSGLPAGAHQGSPETETPESPGPVEEVSSLSEDLPDFDPPSLAEEVSVLSPDSRNQGSRINLLKKPEESSDASPAQEEQEISPWQEDASSAGVEAESDPLDYVHREDTVASDHQLRDETDSGKNDFDTGEEQAIEDTAAVAFASSTENPDISIDAETGPSPVVSSYSSSEEEIEEEIPEPASPGDEEETAKEIPSYIEDDEDPEGIADEHSSQFAGVKEEDLPETAATEEDPSEESPEEPEIPEYLKFEDYASESYEHILESMAHRWQETTEEDPTGSQEPEYWGEAEDNEESNEELFEEEPAVQVESGEGTEVPDTWEWSQDEPTADAESVEESEETERGPEDAEEPAHSETQEPEDVEETEYASAEDSDYAVVIAEDRGAADEEEESDREAAFKGLVVIQDSGTCDALKEILTDLGGSVKENSRVAGSLIHIKNHEPDILFIDSGLLNKKSRKALRSFQNTYGKDRYKIVAVTDSQFDAQQAENWNIKFHYRLARPFQSGDVLTCLRAVLNLGLEEYTESPNSLATETTPQKTETYEEYAYPADDFENREELDSENAAAGSGETDDESPLPLTEDEAQESADSAEYSSWENEEKQEWASDSEEGESGAVTAFEEAEEEDSSTSTESETDKDLWEPASHSELSEDPHSSPFDAYGEEEMAESAVQSEEHSSPTTNSGPLDEMEEFSALVEEEDSPFEQKLEDENALEEEEAESPFEEQEAAVDDQESVTAGQEEPEDWGSLSLASAIEHDDEHSEDSALKVSVIGQSRNLRKLLADSLSEMSLKSFEDETVQDGMRRVRHNFPDILFIDTRLLDKNGRRSLRKLQTQYGEDRFPVIAVIDSKFDHKKALTWNLKFHDHLLRPFNDEDIRTCLQNILGGEWESLDAEFSQAPEAEAQPAEETFLHEEPISAFAEETVLHEEPVPDSELEWEEAAGELSETEPVAAENNEEPEDMEPTALSPDHREEQLDEPRAEAEQPDARAWAWSTGNDHETDSGESEEFSNPTPAGSSEEDHPDTVSLEMILKIARGFQDINKRLVKIAEKRYTPAGNNPPEDSKE